MKTKISSLLLFFLITSGAYAEKMNKYLFYNALYRLEDETVKLYLEEGYDPNKCRGEALWVDSNPLRVVTENWFSTYDFIQLHSKTLISYPDVNIINYLVKYGANINQLPYIWDKVWSFDNIRLKRITKNIETDKVEIEQIIINDNNRIIKTLLENGADPNMKGHPFPFGKSRKLLFFTDKKAFKYFNSEEATTPIYEAIKKGMTWESQIDLLLEYGAELDESCLKAAKLSGEQAMIDKIEKLMKERAK
jgi:hypothetical protein